MTITPADKDKPLQYFGNKKNVRFVFSASDNAKDVGINEDRLAIIFNQFIRKGLIGTDNISSSGHYLVHLKAEFFDLDHNGGFVAQEELLLYNVHQLLLQIDVLKK